MAKVNAVKPLTTEQQTMLDSMTPLRRKMALNTLKGMKPGPAHKKAGGTCNNEAQRHLLGNQILSNPIVADFLASVNQDIAEETKIDAAYVLKRLYEIDNMDMLDIMNDDGSIKPLREWPKVWRTSLSGFEVAEMFEAQANGNQKDLVGLMKKIKWPDTTKNLELLGKHKAVNAFKEVIEHNHKGVVFNMNFGGDK